MFAPAAAAGHADRRDRDRRPGSADVSWTAPASGGPVDVLRGHALHRRRPPRRRKTITGTPPATSTTVTGLTAGTAYTFRVRAANTAGDGPRVGARRTRSRRLGAGAPAAPTGVSAAPDSEAAVVRWTAPATTAAAPMTGYTVTPYVGGAAQTPVPSTPRRPRDRVTGLSTARATRSASRRRTAPARAPRRRDERGHAAALDLRVRDAGDRRLRRRRRGRARRQVPRRRRRDVTGVRFYKAAANTGTHVGSLWTRPARCSRRPPSPTRRPPAGRRSSSPRRCRSRPTRRTSPATYAPNGHYSVTARPSPDPVGNPPLHALADATARTACIATRATPAFPTSCLNASNYWVDVLFAAGAERGARRRAPGGSWVRATLPAAAARQPAAAGAGDRSRRRPAAEGAAGQPENPPIAPPGAEGPARGRAQQARLRGACSRSSRRNAAHRFTPCSLVTGPGTGDRRRAAARADRGAAGADLHLPHPRRRRA